jgi:TRAP-type C4-dicarboxylate transport system permease small subunit
MAYTRVLRVVVQFLALLAGLGVLAMMAVTCLDVLLRLSWINRPFIGAYDLVKIIGALTLAMALPYTTAVQGHVAIEYFHQKLSRFGRIIVGTIVRLMAMALFLFLCCRSIVYGIRLHETGLVSQTLQLPVFWVPYVIGVCCGVVVLVIAYNLAHPGREMLKP